MGLFDEIRCEYPLPPNGVVDADWSQTKSMPSPYMDKYLIASDGTLCKLERMMDGSGFARVGCFYTGEILFEADGAEFSSYFVRGKLKHIERLDDDEPAAVELAER